MVALAHRFLDAVETGNGAAVEALYTDDVVVWHNHDRLETGRAANLATLARFAELAPERRYHDRRVDAFAGGFVEQHLLVAVAAGGQRLELPACLVCRVEQGRIVRLDEYFDPAPLAAWLAAMAPA